MVEISNSPSTSNPVEENTQTQTPESDRKITRNTKPGVKRLIISVTVLFSFILGFPLLWKSIEIYRALIPFDRVDSFSSQIESKPLSFPCRFQAIFIGFDFMVSNGNVGAAIARKMSDLSHGGYCSGCGGN